MTPFYRPQPLLLPRVSRVTENEPAEAQIARSRGEVSPRSWVVMVTAARSAEVAAHALAAGASRYLTKDTPALKLIDAILEARPAATVTRIGVRRESEVRAAW